MMLLNKKKTESIIYYDLEKKKYRERESLERGGPFNQTRLKMIG